MKAPLSEPRPPTTTTTKARMIDVDGKVGARRATEERQGAREAGQEGGDDQDAGEEPPYVDAGEAEQGWVRDRRPDQPAEPGSVEEGPQRHGDRDRDRDEEEESTSESPRRECRPRPEEWGAVTWRVGAAPDLALNARDDEHERERDEQLGEQRPVVDRPEEEHLHESPPAAIIESGEDQHDPERRVAESDRGDERDADVRPQHRHRAVRESMTRSAPKTSVRPAETRKSTAPVPRPAMICTTTG